MSATMTRGGTGRMRSRVTIQALTETASGFGAADSDAWANVAVTPTVFAEIMPESGSEYYAAQSIRSELTTRLKIRYRSDLTTKHRLILGARTLRIEEIKDPGERHEALLLRCREWTKTE